METLMVFFSHPLVAIVLLLGILILVHESGHFIAGKLCGIAVEIFSIGFGPVLLSYKYGETEYRLSLIPLGGFVKFYGQSSREDVNPFVQGREYYRASIFARFITIFSGPFFNFLLAYLVYFSVGLHGIFQLPAQIGEVVPGSSAAFYGLMSGDVIQKIDGKKITTWRDLQQLISDSPSRKLVFEIDRAGGQKEITVVPKSVSDENSVAPSFSRGQIGITPGFFPPIITLQDPNGRAASFGFRTGDEVISISSSKTTKMLVNSWSDFMSKFELAVKTDFDLEIEVKNVLREASEEDRSNRIIKIDEKLFSEYEKGDLAESLGIRGSHLTVSDYNEKELAREEAWTKKQDFPDSSYHRDSSYNTLLPGDIIVQWQGIILKDYFHFIEISNESKLSTVTIQINRSGNILEVNVPLQRIDVQRLEGRVSYYKLPVVFLGSPVLPPFITEKYSLTGSLGYAAKETKEQVFMISRAIVGLCTGTVPLKALGGPISIGKVASDSVKLGWIVFFTSMALISINLGLLNLLPIPILDGGQLVLIIFEMIWRRPIPERVQENIQKIGFVMILSLVVIATYNDFSRFWLSMLEEISRLIK